MISTSNIALRELRGGKGVRDDAPAITAAQAEPERAWMTRERSGQTATTVYNKADLGGFSTLGWAANQCSRI